MFKRFAYWWRQLRTHRRIRHFYTDERGIIRDRRTGLPLGVRK